MASRAEQLADLRRRLAALGSSGPRPRCVSLGGETINAVLPWAGLPAGAVHEVVGAARDGAATGFCALLLARMAADGGLVLWIAQDGREAPYGPGLALFGLTPERLVVARVHRASDVLWAVEEALRCKALAAVLGEIGARTSLAQARRLQLAAHASGVTAILLTRAMSAPVPSAVTRWQVASTRRDRLPRWRVDLVRCRGRLHGEDGYVARWTVEWRRATGDLAVVPDLRDRSHPAPRRHATR